MKERTRADITIYRADGREIATVPITAGSKRVQKLMGDDYIQLAFTLAEAVEFPIGAYCDDELFGRFYVTDEQMPRYNMGNGGYDYELRLEAWYKLWNLKQFMLLRNTPSDGLPMRSESVWYLTWSLKEQMRQFMRNLQLLGFVAKTYDFTNGDTDLETFVKIEAAAVPKATEALTMSYSGQHLLDALDSMADTWECEWWVTGTEEAFQIHFGKCESGTAEAVSIGDNAENIEAQNDVSERGKKLYYFGGVENIPMTYRKTLMMKSLEETYSGIEFKVKNEELTRTGYLKAYVSYGTDKEQTINFKLLSNDEFKEQAEQWFKKKQKDAQYNRVVLYPALNESEAIPVVTVRLYADFTYIAADGDRVRAVEEIGSGGVGVHWGSVEIVHSMWVQATDENGDHSLNVSQWRDYTSQTKQTYQYWDTVSRQYVTIDKGCLLTISENVFQDAGGRYVTVKFPDFEGNVKLYFNTPASTVRLDGIEKGIIRYDSSYTYEEVGVKTLYDGALVIRRMYEGGKADFWHYDSEGGFTKYGTGNFETTDVPLYVVEKTDDPDLADDWYCCGYFIGNMNNNYYTHRLTMPAQTIRMRFAIDEKVYEKLGDTLTCRPRFLLSMQRDKDYFPVNPLITRSQDDVIISKGDFVFEYGRYYAEYSVTLPMLSAKLSIWGRDYNLFYAVQLPIRAVLDDEETDVEIRGWEMVQPPQFYVEHVGLLNEFYVKAEKGDGDYVKFSWDGLKPLNYKYFYLVEADKEPKVNINEIPAAYWSDMFDDPASLLSIGDRRLQLPVYDAEEFEKHGTGMTYENGYIVKDGMAYKDGYIIPSGMIGDDDNRSLRELTVTDDTIYPDGKLLVKTVKRVNAVDKIDVEGQSESQTWSYKQYHLQLCLPDKQGENFSFDRNYILPNSEPLKIRFLVPEDVKEYKGKGIDDEQWNTIKGNCKLAGMQFNVAYNDQKDYQADDESASTKHYNDYWIERNDDFGAKLPSEVLFPNVLDPCVLMNWNVLALSSLGLIATAEYRLLNKAFEYYAALRDGNFTFTASMMSDWMFDLVGGLQLVTSDGNDFIDADGKNFLVRNGHTVYAIPPLGQKVSVKHAALANGSKETRIIGMELKLDKPYDSPKLTIGETEAYSRLKQMEKTINKISN